MMTTGLNRKSGHPERGAASMRMRFFDRDLDFADFIRALQCLTALYQRPDTCEHSTGFIHFESQGNRLKAVMIFRLLLFLEQIRFNRVHILLLRSS